MHTIECAERSTRRERSLFRFAKLLVFAFLTLSNLVALAQTMQIPASVGPHQVGWEIEGGTVQGEHRHDKICFFGHTNRVAWDKLVAGHNELMPFWSPFEPPEVWNWTIDQCESVEPHSPQVGDQRQHCMPRSFEYVTAAETCYVRDGSGVLQGFGPSLRATYCPAGTIQTQSTPTMMCAVRSEDVCPIGNPVSPTLGTKYSIETDHSSADGISLTRYYSSAGYYYSDSVPMKPAFGHAAWRHTYERSLHPLDPNVTGGIRWLAQGADGLLLYFRPDGSEILNRSDTGASSRIDADGVGWILRNANGDAERYNSSGLLTSITTRAGQVTTVSYDANGRISRVAGPFGHALDFFYDSEDRLNIVRDAANGEIRYAYDAVGRIETVTYPDLRSRRYHYEHLVSQPTSLQFQDLLTGISDENGDRFASYAYDTQGRAVSSEHAGGASRYEFSYSTTAAPFSTIVTDPLGSERTYTIFNINVVHKLRRIVGSSCTTCGNSKETTYDANGNVSTKTDFVGNVTSYVFSSDRNLELTRFRGLFTVTDGGVCHGQEGNQVHAGVPATDGRSGARGASACAVGA